MNFKIRPPKKDDQELAEEAYILLINLIESNQERIEPTLWFGPMICALAENCLRSGWDKKMFLNEINLAAKNYAKQVWKD